LAIEYLQGARCIFTRKSKQRHLARWWRRQRRRRRRRFNNWREGAWRHGVASHAVRPDIFTQS